MDSRVTKLFNSVEFLENKLDLKNNEWILNAACRYRFIVDGVWKPDFNDVNDLFHKTGYLLSDCSIEEVFASEEEASEIRTRLRKIERIVENEELSERVSRDLLETARISYMYPFCYLKTNQDKENHIKRLRDLIEFTEKDLLITDDACAKIELYGCFHDKDLCERLQLVKNLFLPACLAYEPINITENSSYDDILNRAKTTIKTCEMISSRGIEKWKNEKIIDYVDYEYHEIFEGYTEKFKEDLNEWLIEFFNIK